MTTTVFQPGTGGNDCFLNQGAPTTVHNGTSMSLLDAGTSTEACRPVLAFNIAAWAGGEVQGAQLELNFTDSDFSNSAATTVEVWTVTAAFAEAQATWNRRVTGTDWTAPGGDLGTLLGTMEIDAGEGTAILQSSAASVAAAAAAIAGDGILRLAIRFEVEDGDTGDVFSYIFFVSSEGTAALRPKLTLHGPLTPNPDAVRNRSLLRRLWRAMDTRRVSIAQIVDSNGRIFTTLGHEGGMTAGLARHKPFWGGRLCLGGPTGVFTATIAGQVDGPFGTANSASPPAFITGGMFPSTTTSFVGGYVYYNDATTIADDSANPVSLAPDDVSFDAAAALTWHFRYATFASGAGAIRPRARLTLDPWTDLAAETDITTAPLADALVWGERGIAAAARAGTISLVMTDLFGTDSEGPIGLTYHQVEVDDQATGVSYSPLWHGGGLGMWDTADQTVNDTTQDMWDDWFDAVTRLQGGAASTRVLVLHIIHGANDGSNTDLAVDSEGAATGPASNTSAGYKQNCETFIDAVTAFWVAAGYSASNLYFLGGGYHPKEDVGFVEDMEGVWEELAAERPDNIIALMGSEMITGTQMNDRGWFDPDGGDPHLSEAGYTGFGELTWDTYAAGAAGGDSAPSMTLARRLLVMEEA